MITDVAPRAWTHGSVIALGAIMLIAVAVRVAWIAYANVSPLDGRADDTVFYYAAAKSLAHDFEYRDVFGRLTAHWPPGYPLALAPVLRLSGDSLTAAKALNVALSAATVVLTYMLGARLFGVRAGLLGALLLAVAPGHIYFSTLVMAEVLFACVFVAVAVMLVQSTLDDRARWPHLLALGALTGYLTLVRAEAVFLPLAFALLWVLVLRGWRTPARYTAICAVGFVLVLAPWTARNAARFDAFIPLRTGSDGALANGLDPNYLDRPDRFSAPAPPLRDTAGHIARHPWELIPLQADKARYLYRNDSDAIAWLQHEVPLFDDAQVRAWSRLADWYFLSVVAAALVGTALLWQRWDRRRFGLAYLVVAWTAIEIITWPESRYHLPVMPLACMFAGYAVAAAAAGTVNAVRSRSGDQPLSYASAESSAPARSQPP